MTNWYTSDLHIGHEMVAKDRGFDDSAEHDAALARAWDSGIRNDDTVFVLGDIAMNSNKGLAWLAQRPGIKHLITGNHDSINPMHSKSEKEFPRYLEVFKSVQPYTRRKVDGVAFFLCHYPYAEWGDGPDRDGSRYDQYRLPDMGFPLVHGHTHGTEKSHGHEFHVGLDAWHTLVSEEIILDWVRSL